MANKGIICFDMDGTITDFYGVEGWIHYLEEENPYPYIVAEPLWDMEKLVEVLNKLINQGWEIRVISWLAGNSSEEYKEAVRAAKIWWLNKYNFPYKKAHLVAYGTTKADAIRRMVEKGNAILIDDNATVRKGWHLGETIDPTTENAIERLEKLLEG